MGGGISVACVHALAHVCMSCALYVHMHDCALVLYVKVGTFHECIHHSIQKHASEWWCMCV